MRCPSCGATVESVSQRFCQTCGAPLDPQQLRQQAAQTEGGSTNPIISPQLSQQARTSLDNLGNQVNQAISTRNTGQLLVYAGGAVLAVIVISMLIHAILAALPFVIIIAIIAYFRRNRGYRRW
jgi:Flp pilus assembly protein TadB